MSFAFVMGYNSYFEAKRPSENQFEIEDEDFDEWERGWEHASECTGGFLKLETYN